MSRVPLTRVCKECGSEFSYCTVQVRGGRPLDFCGSTCNTERRRQSWKAKRSRRVVMPAFGIHRSLEEMRRTGLTFEERMEIRRRRSEAERAKPRFRGALFELG